MIQACLCCHFNSRASLAENFNALQAQTPPAAFSQLLQGELESSVRVVHPCLAGFVDTLSTFNTECQLAEAQQFFASSGLSGSPVAVAALQQIRANIAFQSSQYSQLAQFLAQANGLSFADDLAAL